MENKVSVDKETLATLNASYGSMMSFMESMVTGEEYHDFADSHRCVVVLTLFNGYHVEGSVSYESLGQVSDALKHQLARTSALHNVAPFAEFWWRQNSWQAKTGKPTRETRVFWIGDYVADPGESSENPAVAHIDAVRSENLLFAVPPAENPDDAGAALIETAQRLTETGALRETELENLKRVLGAEMEKS